MTHEEDENRRRKAQEKTQERMRLADRELDRAYVLCRVFILLSIIGFCLNGIIVGVFQQHGYARFNYIYTWAVSFGYVITFLKWSNGVTIICREVIKQQLP